MIPLYGNILIYQQRCKLIFLMKNPNPKIQKKAGIATSKSMYCLFQPEKIIPSKIEDLKQKQSYVLSNNNTNKKSCTSLKLRDYIFQLQINSKKNEQVRKLSPDRTSPKYSLNSSLQFFKNNASKSEIRSGKYEIDKKHIIKVISQQAIKDLDNIMALVNSIKKQFEQLKNEEVEQKDMAEIYNFRRTIKDKLLKQMISLDERVKKRGDESQFIRKEQMDGLLTLGMSIINEETEELGLKRGMKKISELSILVEEQDQPTFREK